jgi:hypothetical protein
MTDFPHVIYPPAESVPSKCAGPTGAGVERNPCTEPGKLPRCQLCPDSPTYRRHTKEAK